MEQQKQIVVAEKESLLQAAKRIFGDSIVVNAWYAVDADADSNMKSCVKKVTTPMAFGDSSVFFGDGVVDKYIIIEFITGNTVAFSSSDGGWAELITQLNFVKV